MTTVYKTNHWEYDKVTFLCDSIVTEWEIIKYFNLTIGNISLLDRFLVSNHRPPWKNAHGFWVFDFTGFTCTNVIMFKNEEERKRNSVDIDKIVDIFHNGGFIIPNKTAAYSVEYWEDKYCPEVEQPERIEPEIENSTYDESELIPVDGTGWYIEDSNQNKLIQWIENIYLDVIHLRNFLTKQV